MKQLNEQVKVYSGQNSKRSSFSVVDSIDENFILKAKPSNLINTLTSENLVEPTPKCILHPSGRFKSFWNLIVAVLLIYTATVMPFSMAFVETEPFDTWFYLDLLLDGLFLVDVLINTLTAFYDPEGNLVVGRGKIFCRYAKSWMLIDLLACMPFGLLELESGDESSNRKDYNNLLRLLRLPRLYRLLRISRLLKIIKHYKHSEFIEKIQDFLSIKHSAMRLINSFMAIMLCVHLVTCFWYYSSVLEGFHPDTWVVRAGYADETTTTKYIASMYWSFTTLTTVGYGDISPYTNFEKIIATLWMLFGLYFLSFTVGSLASMLSSFDTKENVLLSKLAVIDEFSKESNLDRELKHRLRHALRYSTEKKGFSFSDKQSIFNELPKSLRYEVAMNMHQGAAKHLNFFRSKDSLIVASIVPLLHPMFLSQKDFVYKKGELADEIYFIVRGRISYVFGTQNVVIKSMQRGSYFGDIEVLLEVSRKYSARAVRDSEILIMNRQLIHLITQEFPSLWDEMRETAVKRNKSCDKAFVEVKELLSMQKSGEISQIDVGAFKHKVSEILKYMHPEKQTRKRSMKYEDVVDRIDKIYDFVFGSQYLDN